MIWENDYISHDWKKNCERIDVNYVSFILVCVDKRLQLIYYILMFHLFIQEQKINPLLGEHPYGNKVQLDWSSVPLAAHPRIGL